MFISFHVVIIYKGSGTMYEYKEHKGEPHEINIRILKKVMCTDH